MDDTVDDALIKQIREDGYGVLEGALTPGEVDEINAEAVRLCRGELGEIRSGAAVSLDAGRWPATT